MKEYYVYGLIDPRTNTIFYIGKGKGKRVFQHFNEKEEIHSNTEKLKIINDVHKENLQVGHVLIGENLSEDAALLLEKLLIYRIGRKIFDEGILTNIVPGGKWHKEAPIFLDKDKIPTEEIIKSKFPEIIPILNNYPHVAIEFTGLRCPNNSEDENIYVFDNSGRKIHTWDISYFIQIFGLGSALDIINVLKENTMPVYFGQRIWSKTYYKNLIDISKIPFQDLDVINLDFITEINDSISKSESKQLKCFYPNETIHMEVEVSTKEVKLIYYYQNQNKKHISTYLDNKLNDNCQSWFENGQLKEEIIYDRNIRLSKQTFYPSGKIELIEKFNDDGTGKSCKIWYENGQLRFENNDDGTSFKYSETGAIKSKGIRIGNIRKGGYSLIQEFYENGNLKKETKNYYTNHLLHGYEKSFFDTGEVHSEIDYTNGFNNKIIKTYTKDGKTTIK
jgi:antitoxin component YwqK of YwqJK toxin-antitoxin module